MIKTKLLNVLIIVSSLFFCQAQAELVVVVNSRSDVSTLDKSELARLFMGKSTTLIPVNQVYSTSAYDEFCQTYLGKDATKMKAYWLKQMFMGKATPPQAFGSDAEVINFIGLTPNAVGYVDSASVTDAVKVVTIN